METYLFSSFSCLKDETRMVVLKTDSHTTHPNNFTQMTKCKEPCSHNIGLQVCLEEKTFPKYAFYSLLDTVGKRQTLKRWQENSFSGPKWEAILSTWSGRGHRKQLIEDSEVNKEGLKMLCWTAVVRTRKSELDKTNCFSTLRKIFQFREQGGLSENCTCEM